MTLTSYTGDLSFLISDGGKCVPLVPGACPISEVKWPWDEIVINKGTS